MAYLREEYGVGSLSPSKAQYFSSKYTLLYFWWNHLNPSRVLNFSRTSPENIFEDFSSVRFVLGITCIHMCCTLYSSFLFPRITEILLECFPARNNRGCRKVSNDFPKQTYKLLKHCTHSKIYSLVLFCNWFFLVLENRNTLLNTVQTV